MARYTGPVCRLCRREGGKLFLKGDRCFTDKCAFERRKYPPGQHGMKRAKISDYALQLREKQKLKRIYGVVERQFRRYFEEAQRKKGVTGEMLIQFLERRLDNVVYRMGFGVSRRQARQLVNHGHVMVNGRVVDIPSYRVNVGDVVEIKPQSRKIPFIEENLSKVQQRGVVPWIEVEPEAFRGRFVRLPERAEVPVEVEEHLIVELYSK